MSLNPDTQTLRRLQQENARLRDECQALHDELLRLKQAIRALTNLQYSLDGISPESNIFTLINGLLSAALEAVDSEDGSLQLLDEEKDQLVFVEVRGDSREKLRGYRMPVMQGVSGWVVRNRKPELVPDVRQEPRFAPQVDQRTGFRTTSLICVPLMDGERCLGAIEVVNTRSGAPFSPKDLDILLLVARLASLALVRAEGPLPTP